MAAVPGGSFAGAVSETSFGLNGANKESNIFYASHHGARRPDGRDIRDHPYSRYGGPSGFDNNHNRVREERFEVPPGSLISAFDGQRYHYSSFDAYSARHMERISISFFDGHVESIDSDDIPSMMYADFERDPTRRPTSWYRQ
ncbi:MAG: hypothetical protein JJU36_01840 [Phycisphaeraceae bacterium]|nr:hypothetical protein [Phycisphaeraceae bacterium]